MKTYSFAYVFHHRAEDYLPPNAAPFRQTPCFANADFVSSTWAMQNCNRALAAKPLEDCSFLSCFLTRVEPGVRPLSIPVDVSIQFSRKSTRSSVNKHWRLRRERQRCSVCRPSAAAAELALSAIYRSLAGSADSWVFFRETKNGRAASPADSTTRQE
jgi:hypothetical protein